MTRRTERVSATLLRALQGVIVKGISDPRVRGLITVTEVSVSPDLAEARVSVSVLPDSDQELTLHGLQAAATHIRHEVSEVVDLHRMPRLIFRADPRIKKEAAVLKDIHRAAEATGAEGVEKPRWAPAPGRPGRQQSGSDGEGAPNPRKEAGE